MREMRVGVAGSRVWLSVQFRNERERATSLQGYLAREVMGGAMLALDALRARQVLLQRRGKLIN